MRLLKMNSNKQFYIPMEKQIDVTSDYIFKGIFRDPDRARDFLENVLVGEGKILPEGTIIQEIEYLPTEHIQDKLPEDAKKTIFDLQIKTTHGIFIIEMQKNISQEYLKRIEFYNAISYSHQQIKNSKEKSSMRDYTKAFPIVTVSVIKDMIFDEAVPCVSYHTTIESKTKKQYLNAFSYVFIELEKFNNPKYDQANISISEKEWLSFMKTQELEHQYDNEQVNNAVKYVQYIKNNNYDEYIRAEIAEMAAKIKEREAREEGVEKGIEIGIGKGREEGREEGRGEGIEKVAKNLLKQGIEISIIATATGLTEDEISKLKD